MKIRLSIHAAVFVVLTGRTVIGQEDCNFPAPVCPSQATCPDGCIQSCNPDLEHGLGATAACSPRCVGETLNCTATSAYVDQLLDVIRLEEVFDTVAGTVRVPAVGNLPIIRVFDNAVCTNSGGVCNVTTGANCAFPCLIGPGGVVYADPSTGLTLPGTPLTGRVRVADFQYVIQPGDVGNLTSQFVFVATDLCTSCCKNCAQNCDSTTASSVTPVPDCGDSDECNIDCCVSGVPFSEMCSHPSSCTGTTCRDTSGNIVTVPPRVCSDQNSCTRDTCVNDTDPATACCESEFDCREGGEECCPDDGNPCTTESCNKKGVCKSRSDCRGDVDCDDQNSCTDDMCTDEGCCENAPHCPDGVICCADGTSCSDGLVCTDDSCGDDGCCDYSPHCPPDVICCGDGRSCSDGNPCTDDTCVDGCCVYTPALCNNGLFCDGIETCDVAQGCLPGVPVSCDDGVACTNDECVEDKDLCTHTPTDTACDDGLFCNGTEVCHPTQGCLPGTPPSCIDGANCSTDTCNVVTDQCDHVCDVPEITCINQTFECDDVGEFLPPVVEDDCSENPVATCTEVITPGKLPQERTITRTCSFTNDCGNSVTCEQVIDIEDTTPPQVTCPPDRRFECDGIGESGEPIVSDNCDPDPQVTVVVEEIVGDCTPNTAGISPPPKLIRLNTFTVSDGAATVATGDTTGNITTCTQRIEIIDTHGPIVVSCPASVPGCAGQQLVFTPPTCSDTCGTCSVVCTRSDGLPLGDPVPVDPLTIRCVARDECENASAPCDVTVTNDKCDNEIPTVSQWGLVVLALLLLIGAKLRFSRHHPGLTS